MKNIRIAFWLLATLCVAASCNKSSLLGSELFESDKLNLQFTDSLTIRAVNETSDSVIMSSGGIAFYDLLPLGWLRDSIFGSQEAAIYSNFLNVTSPDTSTFPTATIDSVRLILPYNGSNIYGDTTLEQKVSVFRLTTELKSDIIFSNRGSPWDPS